MPVHKRTSVGDPATLPFSQAFLNDLVDIANAYNRGELTRLGDPGGAGTSVVVTNVTGATVEAGDAVAIIPTLSVRPANAEKTKRAPSFNLDSPLWFGNLNQVIVLPRSIQPNNSTPVTLPTWISANVSGVNGDSEDWAMVDPAEPKKFKLATGGLARVIGYDSGNGFAVLDFRESQPIWQYRVTSDGDPLSCELQELDGTVFATNVAIEFPGQDPEKLKADDVGTCVFAGNKFVATSGSAFDCEDLCDCEGYLAATPNFCPDPS